MSKQKSFPDKINPWVSMILSLITLVQIIFTIFFISTNETLKIIFLSLLIIAAIFIILMLFKIYTDEISIFTTSRITKRKSYNKTKELYSQKLAEKCDEKDIKEKAKEICKSIPNFLLPKPQNIVPFYSYLCLEIELWNVDYSFGKTEKSDVMESLFLCKFIKDKNNNDIGHIQSTPNIKEKITSKGIKDALIALHWETILNELINDDWKTITIECDIEENKRFLKHCLIKDEYLLIYDHEEVI